MLIVKLIEGVKFVVVHVSGTERTAATAQTELNEDYAKV